jgi:DnaJ-class molecular chaperone
MPDRKNGCKRGDLIVTIDVQFPDHISDEVKGLAEKLPAFTDNDRT